MFNRVGVKAVIAIDFREQTKLRRWSFAPLHLQVCTSLYCSYFGMARLAKKFSSTSWLDNAMFG